MRQRPGDCCANGTGLPPRPMTATTVTRGHPIKLCCECRVYQSNEWDAVLLPSEEHQALRFWRTEVLVCRRHVLNEIRRQVLHPPATCLHDRSRLSKASDPNLVWCIESTAAQTIRGMLDEHARWVKCVCVCVCVCDSEVSPGTRCLSCCASPPIRGPFPVRVQQTISSGRRQPCTRASAKVHSRAHGTRCTRHIGCSELYKQR